MKKIIKTVLFIGILCLCVSMIDMTGRDDNEQPDGRSKYIREREGLRDLFSKGIRKASEEEEQKKTMDRLISQIHENLAAEYWLFDYKRKCTGETFLELYVDSPEDINYLVLISSSKLPVINEDGEMDEALFYFVSGYDVRDGNIVYPYVSTEVERSTLEEAREVLTETTVFGKKEFIYFGTMDSWQWPKARCPVYDVELLESTEIYQNFDIYMEERAGLLFTEETEAYLGLWNGYSGSVWFVWTWRDSEGILRYSMASMELTGSRSSLIFEITEEIYERFQLMSVRMLPHEDSGACPVEVTIRRLDESIRSDAGEAIGEAYYDLPILSGSLESCSRINDYFMKEYQNWLAEEGRFHSFSEGAFQRFSADTERGRAEHGEEHMAEFPFEYKIETRIEFVNDSYLSIVQRGHWRTEGSSAAYFFGHTFDLQTGELLPINAFLDTDADSFRDMIITVLEEYEDSMCLTERMKELAVIYGKNANSDYEMKYEDTSAVLNYEYYYDGTYFYIILNHGIFDSSACLLKWNGKYGDERESILMLYEIPYEDMRSYEKNMEWVDQIYWRKWTGSSG